MGMRKSYLRSFSPCHSERTRVTTHSMTIASGKATVPLEHNQIELTKNTGVKACGDNFLKVQLIPKSPHPFRELSFLDSKGIGRSGFAINIK